MLRHLCGRLAVLGLIFTLVVHCGSPATLIRVTGAENMKGFAERLTEWYARKNPGVQFRVSASRIYDAYAALASGGAEIVQATRRPLPSEEEALRSGQGRKYVQLQIATEIAGMAVHSSNPIKELSLMQLRRVLSGEIRNWKQLNGNDAPIAIYGRDDSSDVRFFLEQEFMGDSKIASSAKVFPSNSAMFVALSQDPNGIGFGTVEFRSNDKVRFLAIKSSDSAEAIAPTGDAIRAKRYPLVRPLYFYFASAPSGELYRFAQWVLSSEGQLVVEAVGYFPLTSAEREAGLQEISAK